MADTKITALTALTAADPANDVIPIVDVSDTSMAASGTTKKISINNLLSSSPTATGALTVTGLVTAGSSTITGALTVGTTLGVTGVSTFAAGTALLPALTTTGDTNTGIYYPAADTFAVTTGGTERYRVDSAGQLGIGVTPSAWSNPYKCVQLSGGSLSVYPTTDLYISQNAYNSGGWKRVAAGYASQYIQTNSEHRFLVAGTDPTVDSAIAFTQAMTLDASGNLLVGTTTISPSINGAGAITAKGVAGITVQTVAAILTDYTLPIGAFAGILTIRSNGSGGSAVWMLDPNAGAVSISNNIVGRTITFTFSGGSWKMQQTVGVVPSTYNYLVLATQ